MTAGLRLLISGRVQGVGYRVFAAHAAREHGVSGWVRNLPGGQVEVEAVADDPAALEAFLGWLRQGPPGGLVELVESRAVEAAGRNREFQIRA